MPGSVILIEYEGTDISSYCLYDECSFESQMAAIPGSFTVVVKDMGQTLNFVTGKELTLTVDGIRLYGGYVLQVTKRYAFPADDTTDVNAVQSRQWVLTGSDWNILFDKRVLRNTSDYTHNIPKVAGTHTDAYVIKNYFSTYFDIPAGFNFTSATYILDNYTYGIYDSGYTWNTQGTTMREVLDQLAIWGSVYWISADKQFHYIPVQNTAAPWGFSDVPNGQAYGATPKPLIGFRDGEYTEDATAVINDALVWGGSEWAAGGAVVFARRENATSISAHKRWQLGEVRAGEDGFKIQSQVTARAKVIVDGNLSGTFTTGSKGLVNPEQQFRCTWYSVDVPENAGNPVHLLPGSVVPIELWVFSEDAGTTPFSVSLPLRQMSISFPGLAPDGSAYIEFTGFFGVLMSDPFWLWDFLRSGKKTSTTALVTSSANNSSTSPMYGAVYQGAPSPAPNGAITAFTIPFGYLGGTLKLYVNGILQLPSAYTESSPASGQFTMSFAPHTTDTLFVEATLTG